MRDEQWAALLHRRRDAAGRHPLSVQVVFDAFLQLLKPLLQPLPFIIVFFEFFDGGQKMLTHIVLVEEGDILIW